MTDLTTQPPRYGSLNLDYIATWQAIPDHQPMWALNLMHYRDVADYRDGRESTLTGQQADDLYAPLEPLAAVGARLILVAPVVEQLVGDSTVWDRIAIVRYPNRHAMVEMEGSPDFQKQHVHKEAGMAATIVSATYPRLDSIDTRSGAADDLLLLHVVADDSGPSIATPGCRPIARFDVDGVIIGDSRSFAAARWYSLPESELPAVRAAVGGHRTSADSYAIVMKPFINEFVAALAEVSSSS